MVSGSNSPAKMLAILNVFSESRLEWTSEELMNELGYARPTLYRYLKTLKAAGFLSSLPNSGYTLGPKIVELDYLLRRSDPLVLAGRPILQELAARYPCMALLVRWYGDRVLCVHAEKSEADTRTSYARGRPMPMTRGAISRAILAFLPRRQLGQIVAAHLDEFRDVGLGETEQAVVEMLMATRKAGVAIAHGEVTPGVYGIAAPVFDIGNVPVASLSITIEERHLDPDELTGIADFVRCRAQHLSRLLVGPWQGDGD